MDGFARASSTTTRRRARTSRLLGWDKATRTARSPALRRHDQGQAQSPRRFIQQGADIIFPVAGRAGLGARCRPPSDKRQVNVIWVDTDGCVWPPSTASTPDHGREGMDAPCEYAITDAVDGKFSNEDVRRHARERRRRPRAVPRRSTPRSRRTSRPSSRSSSSRSSTGRSRSADQPAQSNTRASPGRGSDRPGSACSERSTVPCGASRKSHVQGRTMKLELRGITKRFGSLRRQRPHRPHRRARRDPRLLGENGAGKSHADERPLRAAPRRRGRDPRRRRAGHVRRPRATPSPPGIGMVHQHFMLVPVFTVAENVMLGHEQTRRRRRPRPRAGAPAGARDRPSGSASTSTRTRWSRTCRSASSSASRSSRRCPATRTCSSSTSRPRCSPRRRPTSCMRDHARSCKDAGQVDRLHHPQAARGQGGRRPDHRDPARQGRRRPPSPTATRRPSSPR